MQPLRDAIPSDRDVRYEGFRADVGDPRGANHAQPSDPARILLAEALVQDRGDFRRVLSELGENAAAAPSLAQRLVDGIVRGRVADVGKAVAEAKAQDVVAQARERAERGLALDRG